MATQNAQPFAKLPMQKLGLYVNLALPNLH